MGWKDDLGHIAALSASFASFAAAAYILYSTHEFYSSFSSPESSSMEKKELARKLKRPELESVEFSKHEMSIALDVICADDLKTSFSDVGGMEVEIEIIMDNVILPFKFWQEENNRQLQLEQKQTEQEKQPNKDSQTSESADMGAIDCHVPGGMLMYGKPGTGKTMLAKAIAKEAEASFIGVKSGTILDKYVGESDKLVTAIFSLAQKIAPTVIFIDEVDTLLKKRESLQSGSSSSISSMLGILMSEWDGLNSDGKAPVIVLGATNRPSDIDSAFLRRMPLTIETRAPDFPARRDIMTKMLQKEMLSDDVDVDLIAASTEGFTGSDLREICRLASISRMKELLQHKKNRKKSTGDEKSDVVDTKGTLTEDSDFRPLKQAHFDRAIAKALQDGEKQATYSQEQTIDEMRNYIMRAAMGRKQPQSTDDGETNDCSNDTDN